MWLEEGSNSEPGQISQLKPFERIIGLAQGACLRALDLGDTGLPRLASKSGVLGAFREAGRASACLDGRFECTRFGIRSNSCSKLIHMVPSLLESLTRNTMLRFGFNGVLSFITSFCWGLRVTSPVHLLHAAIKDMHYVDTATSQRNQFLPCKVRTQRNRHQPNRDATIHSQPLSPSV